MNPDNESNSGTNRLNNEAIEAERELLPHIFNRIVGNTVRLVVTGVINSDNIDNIDQIGQQMQREEPQFIINGNLEIDGDGDLIAESAVINDLRYFFDPLNSQTYLEYLLQRIPVSTKKSNK